MSLGIRTLTLAIGIASAFSAQAQFVQQGDKLLGTGAIGGALQGCSVALSGDGGTAIVGGYYDNSKAGAAWIFTRTGGVWTQQGVKLVGTGANGLAYQGYSVAISSDGNTAVIGGNQDSPGGAIWVFTRAGSTWTQQGGKLVNGESHGLGDSVSISSDGNTILAGNGAAGYVFTRTAGVWSLLPGMLVGTDAVSGSASGLYVALSGDGNTAIVGGFERPEGDGVEVAWFFNRVDGLWKQQGGKVTVGPYSYGSAAISADGNTAIFGASGDNNRAGAAWIFTRSNGVWIQQGNKLVGTKAINGSTGANQGNSVALSGDGNIALVGGLFDNSFAGATWVFTRYNGVWTQSGDKLVGTGAVTNATQGFSVALSSDGNTAMVGGATDGLILSVGINPGATWVFANPGTPLISSLVNGASFLPGIAPGTWLAIKGTNLASTTRTWRDSDFTGVNLPPKLDGVGVTVNGKPAYVAFISPTQLNILSPDDPTKGTVSVQVTTSKGKGNIVSANQDAIAPALFTYSQQNGRYVAAVRSDSSYIAPPDLIAGLTTVPARRGDTILLFGTGFGPTSPANPTGQLPTPAVLATPVTVKIGGITTDLAFAGLVGPGEYQFNIVVPPDVPDGDNAVWVEIGGTTSQANVFINVRQ